MQKIKVWRETKPKLIIIPLNFVASSKFVFFSIFELASEARRFKSLACCIRALRSLNPCSDRLSSFVFFSSFVFRIPPNDIKFRTTYESFNQTYASCSRWCRCQSTCLSFSFLPDTSLKCFHNCLTTIWCIFLHWYSNNITMWPCNRSRRFGS